MHAKLHAIRIWSVYFQCWYMHTFCVCVGIPIQTLTLSSGIRQRRGLAYLTRWCLGMILRHGTGLEEPSHKCVLPFRSEAGFCIKTKVWLAGQSCQVQTLIPRRHESRCFGRPQVTCCVCSSNFKTSAASLMQLMWFFSCREC